MYRLCWDRRRVKFQNIRPFTTSEREFHDALPPSEIDAQLVIFGPKEDGKQKYTHDGPT